MIYLELTTDQVATSIYEDKDNNGFSWTACLELAEYLEEMSEEQDISLDVVALRCEWSEYTLKELKESYQSLRGYASVLEYLEENTQVILVSETHDKPTTWLVQEF